MARLHPRKPSVHDRLGYIHERARTQPEASFDNVFHFLKFKLLWMAFRKLKLNKAPGLDGVSVEDYGSNLLSNLQDLETRLQRGTYRPEPSLRRQIPKGKWQDATTGHRLRRGQNCPTRSRDDYGANLRGRLS